MNIFTKLKAIVYTISFFILSIGVLVASSIIGIILSILTVIGAVFTGLWLMWFVSKDFDKPDDDE